ncbi:hypothetical protein [Nonomuraea africana]|uniref:hypothetical protein n=1 Tax=Nonomuraea africana TaxID=46171 RepID=UPI0033DF47B8
MLLNESAERGGEVAEHAKDGSVVGFEMTMVDRLMMGDPVTEEPKGFQLTVQP